MARKEYLKMTEDQLQFLSLYYKGEWLGVTEKPLLNLEKKRKPSLTTLEKKKERIITPLKLIPRLVTHNHVAIAHALNTMGVDK
eukprot:snap_masked-scaffold_35-processed-gene-1.22-mRNA-1 protein AED:1.00 eAED:1.00 QI:0/-1/0/0/-1/1/1/0/83